jgi:hypothetical protein
MSERLTNTKVEAALQDLKHRTLAAIEPNFARLIYIASTRDYNTGRYYHDGLALRFSEEIAASALAELHREIFSGLALRPLRDLAREIQLYVESVGAEPSEILRGWERLEPYRVVVPMETDALTVSLFLSNVSIALPIVASRLQGAP